MLNLRWSWHPPTVELFESIDPAGWAASGGDPVALLSPMRPGQLAALAAHGEVPPPPCRGRRRPAPLYGGAALVRVGRRGRRRVAAQGDRVLLAGVRHHRGP